SERHLKTLLVGRIAAITSGGLNEAWEIQVSVAAPCCSPFEDVITYRPFDISLNVRLRTAASMTRVTAPRRCEPPAGFRSARARRRGRERNRQWSRSIETSPRRD